MAAEGLVPEAICFARRAHANQARKYTQVAYIYHPFSVMMTVSCVTNDQEVIAAAVLHDVVEDTTVTLDEIRAKFGPRVACLVSEVSDPSRPEDGNRAVR